MAGCKHIWMMGIVAVAALAVSCGQTGTPPTPAVQSSTSTPTAVSPTVPLPRKPTAADRLARYFAAAHAADARIREAAIMINAELGASGPVEFSPPARDAVSRADPAPAAVAIPAGLRPRLMWAVLRVQNDLEARYWAFRRVIQPEVRPQQREDLLRCLSGGAAPAARFASDLWAARRLAAGSSAVAPVPRTSRAAATLAVRLQAVALANSGCDGCGGDLFTHLPVVRWHPIAADGNHWDGTVNRIPFRAIYHARSGWEIRLNAC